jgi:hypothetical protein
MTDTVRFTGKDAEAEQFRPIDGGILGYYPTRVGEVSVTDNRFPYFTPERHGALCDGVTADDTALQNAITSAGVLSGTVVLKPSTLQYLITSKITIAAPVTIEMTGATVLMDFPVGTINADGGLLNIESDNVKIIGGTIAGNGAGTITGVNRYAILSTPSGATRYTGTEIRNVRFENLVQYAGGTHPATLTVMYGIYLRQNDGALIEKNTFDTLSGTCVYLSDTTGAKVKGNSMTAFGWSGVVVHDTNYDFEISGNFIYGGASIAAPSYWGGAIDVMGQTSDGGLPGLPSKKGVIKGNQFIGGVYRYGQVIRLASAHSVDVEGNLFDQCDAENNATPSTSPGTASGAGAHNVHIAVSVRDVTLNQGPWSNITIRGNKFRALGAGYQTAILVYASSGTGTNTTACSGLIIEGNEFIAPDSSNYFGGLIYGHAFDAGINDVTIAHNVGKGTGGANAFYNPPGLISFIASAGTATSRQIKIRGNTFEQYPTAGTTNSHSGTYFDNRCGAEIEGNTWKNFFRSITVASTAGDVPILDNTHMVAASGSAYVLSGAVYKPGRSTYGFRVAATLTQTSTTTLASLTELAVPIGANEVLHLTYTMDVGGTLSTTGLQLAVTTPSGAAQNIIASVMPDVIAAGNTISKRTGTSGAALDFTAATQVGVGTARVTVDVYVSNGATAGVVNIQRAQSTSSATALEVRTGAAVRAERLS